MPEPRHSRPKKLDRGARLRQHQSEGVLLGECRFIVSESEPKQLTIFGEHFYPFDFDLLNAPDRASLAFKLTRNISRNIWLPLDFFSLLSFTDREFHNVIFRHGRFVSEP